MTAAEMLKECRPEATFSYRAPSGVMVFSCIPESEPDPWARSWLAYGWHSYRHLWKVLKKERARRRKARREQ